MSETPNLSYIEALSDGDDAFKHKILNIIKNEYILEREIYTKNLLSKDHIATADNVHKLKSLCKMCGDGTKALFTIRNLECLKVKDTPQILVGQEDTYMTVCRKHLKEHNIKKKNLTE